MASEPVLSTAEASAMAAVFTFCAEVEKPNIDSPTTSAVALKAPRIVTSDTKLNVSLSATSTAADVKRARVPRRT